MNQLVLAIDQGTTGTTVLAVEWTRAGAQVLGRGYSEVPQHFPQPGWVEHDLMEIWEGVGGAVRAALDASGRKPGQVAAIGITNQRETSGLWTPAGAPVARALVWQDRRTAADCRRLKDAGHEALFRARTGLVLDPYFSGTKLAWMLARDRTLADKARGGELRFGTIDTWLVYRLTGGAAHVTDVSNASRTLMFDIHRRRWDPELCALLGDIPMEVLPRVAPSAERYGVTRGLGFLPDGIPVAGMAGDQQAALFGQACFAPGMAKCTYGTGAFILMNTGTEPVVSRHGLLTTVAWQVGDRTEYALEGSAFVAGAAVQWLRDGLGIIRSSAEVEALAASVPDTGGVQFVPALAGLGAPHWRPEARGVLTGLTRGSTRAHIARATLEGIALQVYDLLEAMERDVAGSPGRRALTTLRVDGGAAANDLLMQFQADLLGVELHRPKVLDTTALGAAYLAMLGVGVVSSPAELGASWALDRCYQPTMQPDAVHARVEAWRSAVAKA